MDRIIGIDIGGTTTKIVGLADKRIFGSLFVRANDPVASIYGALGKFLNQNGLHLADISKIMVTGVGSSYISDNLYDIPTVKVDEFTALGRGGLYLSGLSRAIIVSMGTGTAIVMADNQSVRHIGGSGIGGGTLLGLSNRMLNVRNFDDLIETAKEGDLSNIDLTIADITKDTISGLSPESTASNFGKISDLASKADIALGIINLVFQTIGMLCVFSSRIDNVHDVVVTGNLTIAPQLIDIFEQLEKLYSVKFIIPPDAEYATAAGAALSAQTV
jgi:type II pantothenate kinase